jgi:hypothetical protein
MSLRKPAEFLLDPWFRSPYDSAWGRPSRDHIQDRTVGAYMVENGCKTCLGRFVIALRRMVMMEAKAEEPQVLECDGIQLCACSRCDSFVALTNHHASRFFRCPGCTALCSSGDEPLLPAGRSRAKAAGRDSLRPGERRPAIVQG